MGKYVKTFLISKQTIKCITVYNDSGHRNKTRSLYFPDLELAEADADPPPTVMVFEELMDTPPVCPRP